MRLVWHPPGIEWVRENGRLIAVVYDAPYATDADNPSSKTQFLTVDGEATYFEKCGPDLPPPGLFGVVNQGGEFTEIGRRIEYQLLIPVAKADAPQEAP